jgi:hypothetical protein
MTTTRLGVAKPVFGAMITVILADRNRITSHRQVPKGRHSVFGPRGGIGSAGRRPPTLPPRPRSFLLTSAAPTTPPKPAWPDPTGRGERRLGDARR